MDSDVYIEVDVNSDMYHLKAIGINITAVVAKPTYDE